MYIRSRNYTIPLLLLGILGVLPSVGMAQEYRYEVGAYVGAASYLGDANRRIPMIPLGGQVGGEFRFNYNFRFALSGQLGYSYLPFNTKYAQTYYPPSPKGETQGVSHLIRLQTWAEYNFAHYSDKFRYLGTKALVPFISGGISAVAFRGGATGNFLVSPGIALRTGLKYKLRNRLNLITSIDGTYYLSDQIDTPTRGTSWLSNPYVMPRNFFKGGDAIIALTISITYEIDKRAAPCHNTNLQ